ncbi:MmgE/PrpD family protein [Sphingosinicella sp. CPCC 101087]|uniref:MmgE/PrpD family protein n=1 Tax=Sphingosinicella sp. CPCC 101087 TaxID=2497754 RepID=UPI00101C03B1|nr:MmgE/PrpD family protein [Sphingosinicella sp. CPCC 101087]
MTANPVQAYGAWLAETPDAWPEAAWESAHRQFIDVIAVSVPGAVEPVTRHVFEAVQAWGDGPAAAIGAGRRLAAPWAALVNGTAAHALDFDDNFDPAKAHATAVLAPAILALAEQEEASGRACLDAYIAGLQILGRVGQGVNPVHRNRGWHATATVGAIGAAAACARLLKLDAEQAGFAVSMATSMAAGFMSQFGTMTKPIHAGLAAKSGIVAAELARAGITAGLATLDGPHGMNRLMVGPDYERLRDGLTHVEHGQNLRFETARVGDPLLILSSGFRVKRFPNCGSAHRAMDGLLALREHHGFSADEVEAIHVRAPVTHLANLMYTDPQDALEAKFSLEYGLAVVLLTGNCTLADFTDASANRAEVRALYARIHRHPVDKAEGEFPTEVEVALKDGRRLETAVPMPVGSLASPFTIDQVWAKYDGCVAGLLPVGDKAVLRAALADLPHLPEISPLMTPLVARFPS